MSRQHIGPPVGPRGIERLALGHCEVAGHLLGQVVILTLNASLPASHRLSEKLAPLFLLPPKALTVPNLREELKRILRLGIELIEKQERGEPLLPDDRRPT